MQKIFYILIAALLATQTVIAQGISETHPYADIILGIYTDSPDFAVIETANWKYLFVENIKEVNYLTGEDVSEFQGKNILVKELKQLDNKTVAAKILIL